ncbi:F-box/kelch-repeat protein At3g06240 [Lactuca sativa]|uniref:F-box/kelch-repeat protein At3g06240 n=1 Tax=Lactuca sativa TaxID=4236 RepID=UPI000CAC9664|nr:F-box/kelch-repeat protein At3g06240 [Lactuca sativa]
MAEHHPSPPNIITELPHDVIFYNILPRLPVKYATSLRCVSKQWNSFLNTRLFTNMHLDHHQNHHKLLLFSDAKPCTHFRSVHCEALEDGFSDSRSLPFVASSSKNITILGSCNGLVCVGVTKEGREDEYYSFMMLWNPLTGEYKRMCGDYSDAKCYKVTGSASELYYKASADDYMVLRVTEDGDAYIYSLKADSWRKLYCMGDLTRKRTKLVWGASILHNGNIYFIDEGVRRIRSRLSFSVIKFNTKKEKFTVMETPRFGDVTTDFLNSMVLEKEGKLHLCVTYKRNSTDQLGGKLWRMDGDVFRRRKVVRYRIPGKFYYLKPLHLMKNGNWVTVCRSGCHVNELDPGRDFEKSSYATTKKDYKIDFRKKGIYIETLVSPNGKMK